MVPARVNAPAFRVEAAAEADLPRLAAIWEASVRATHDFLDEAYFHWIREHLPGFFPLVDLHVARVPDGAIVGFLGVAGDRIEMLFIDPAWRGGGAGRRLTAHAIEALGARTVDVNEQNGQAVGFYQRLGFAVEGRSERDGMGKPYPLLHMRLSVPHGDATAC